jgi:hypothetical protein
MQQIIKTVIVAAMAAGIYATSTPASTFSAWEVSGVAWNDVLNARAWPSTKSAIRAGYPEGTVLQMTGRCMNGVDLRKIGRWPADAQRKAIASTWCEVWHSPRQDGAFQEGWVYGKYIAPAAF